MIDSVKCIFHIELNGHSLMIFFHADVNSFLDNNNVVQDLMACYETPLSFGGEFPHDFFHPGGKNFCEDFVRSIAEGDRPETVHGGWDFVFGNESVEGRVGGSSYFVFFPGPVQHTLQILFNDLPSSPIEVYGETIWGRGLINLKGLDGFFNFMLQDRFREISICIFRDQVGNVL